VDRRTFLLNSAATAGALGLSPLGIAPALAQCGFPSASQGGASGWDMASRKLLVIDACGSIDSQSIAVKPEVLRQCMDSGVTAVNWTVSDTTFEGTVQNMAFVEAMAENDPAHFLVVRRHADIARAAQSHAIGFIQGFQDPGPIEPSLDRLEAFRWLGVLIMQLTYNNRGLYGDGCLEPGNAGLSKLGRAAVERMNTLGIAVDLSHCGQRTTAEGIAASKKPPLITHAGCSAVHAHPRNKDDREIKAMADRGGVMGIYFMPYLVASPTSPSREHVLAHLDHALQVAGTDHVGIGTDGGLNTVPDTPEERKHIQEGMAQRQKLGIAAPEEDRPPYSPDLNTPQRLEIVAAGLQKKGYSTEVVEKVLGGNFNRAFGEIWIEPAGHAT
jgi:membrane dipeptidase